MGSLAQNPPLGLDATDFNERWAGWRVTQAWGALPDPFTAGGGLELSGVRAPMVALRVASLD